MKKLLVIAGTLLFFFVLLGLGVYKLVAPSATAPVPNEQQTYFPQVQSAVDDTIYKAAEVKLRAENADAPNIQLTRLVEDSGYLLGDWADENIGGMIVYKRDVSRWSILLMDGGVIEETDVVSAGVPADVAQRLFSKYNAL